MTIISEIDWELQLNFQLRYCRLPKTWKDVPDLPFIFSKTIVAVILTVILTVIDTGLTASKNAIFLLSLLIFQIVKLGIWKYSAYWI